MTTTAIYAAEFRVREILDRQPDCPTMVIAGSTLTLPVERRFADLASVQTYVTRVLGMSQIRAAYPAASHPVTVRERREAAKATYGLGTIAIPPLRIGGGWAMREIVVLHEIAHHLTPLDDHGPVFRAAFVDLVENCIGPEVGFILRVFYHQNERAS